VTFSTTSFLFLINCLCLSIQDPTQLVFATASLNKISHELGAVEAQSTTRGWESACFSLRGSLSSVRCSSVGRRPRISELQRPRPAGGGSGSRTAGARQGSRARAEGIIKWDKAGRPRARRWFGGGPGSGGDPILSFVDWG
jgi:hypothetical protein